MRGLIYLPVIPDAVNVKGIIVTLALMSPFRCFMSVLVIKINLKSSCRSINLFPTCSIFLLNRQ